MIIKNNLKKFKKKKREGNKPGNSKNNTQYLNESSMNTSIRTNTKESKSRLIYMNLYTINHNPHGISKKKSIIILPKKKKGKEYEIKSSDGPLGCAGTTARASIADSF